MNTSNNSLLLVVFALMIALQLLLISSSTVHCQSATPCYMEETFKFSHANNYSIAMECQVSSEYNELKITFSTYGYGSSVFVLLDSQYSSFLENVKSNPQYLPPEFLHSFYYSDTSYKISKGDVIPKPRDEGYGTIRVLVKRNPTLPATSVSSVYLEMLITPQKNNSKSIVIAVMVVGGLIGVLCCGACAIAFIVFVVKRRKVAMSNEQMTTPMVSDAYQQV